MSTGNRVTESREVSNFDRVALRDYGELVITQGEQESLTIETHPDVLPQIKTEVRDGELVIKIGGSWVDKLGHALSTSFARQWIKYNLTVKKLTGLEIVGALRVNASDLKTDCLSLKLGGAGQVNIEALSAEMLEVNLPGACAINMSGKVGEQRITMSGAGSYKAPKLESRRASVDLRGAGQAAVWAVENLDVTIRGLGSVEYYGTPTVKKNVSGLGTVTSLGNPW
jgi:hypothetical protein